MAAKPQIPSGATSRIIKINVGGKKYHTTEATVSSMGDNYITDLLTGRKPVIFDDDGYYFIDRNGRYFEPILDYMRTGSLVIPPGMSKELVLREATFYLPNMPGNSHSNSNYFARTSCLRVTESGGEASIIFQIGKETEDLGRITANSSAQEQFWSKVLQAMDMVRARITSLNVLRTATDRSGMFGSDDGFSLQINGPKMLANTSTSCLPLSTNNTKNLHKYWRSAKLSSGICVKNSDMNMPNDMVLLVPK